MQELLEKIKDKHSKEHLITGIVSVIVIILLFAFINRGALGAFDLCTSGKAVVATISGYEQVYGTRHNGVHHARISESSEDITKGETTYKISDMRDGGYVIPNRMYVADLAFREGDKYYVSRAAFEGPFSANLLRNSSELTIKIDPNDPTRYAIPYEWIMALLADAAILFMLVILLCYYGYKNYKEMKHPKKKKDRQAEENHGKEPEKEEKKKEAGKDGKKQETEPEKKPERLAKKQDASSDKQTNKQNNSSDKSQHNNSSKPQNDNRKNNQDGRKTDEQKAEQPQKPVQANQQKPAQNQQKSSRNHPKPKKKRR